MRAVGGNLYHKPILPKLAHQRGIFAHGVKDDNIVIQPDLREKAHIFDVKGRQDTMRAGIDAANLRIHDLDVVISSKKNSQEQSQQYRVLN